MPYQSELSLRISNPENFSKFRRENNRFGQGIDVVWGIKPKSEKGPKGGTTEIQSLRFDKDKFTMAQAKDWAKKNNFKVILAESETPYMVKEDATITTADIAPFAGRVLPTLSRMKEYKTPKNQDFKGNKKNKYFSPKYAEKILAGSKQSASQLMAGIGTSTPGTNPMMERIENIIEKENKKTKNKNAKL